MEFYNTYAPGRVPDDYDCSKTKPSGQGGNATKYCLEARYESCALKSHCPLPGSAGTCDAEGQHKIANFLACAEGIPFTTKHHTAYEDLPPCAATWGLDTKAIESCLAANGALPVIADIENATKAASPKVQYFPDIRINGKQCQQCQQQATLLKSICAAYSGTKPKVCSSSYIAALQLRSQQA